MRYHILTTDYDGTLATDSKVSPHIVKSLMSVKATGRKLILVTGRELEDLQSVFPELELFDRVVAENGALLYTPSSKKLKLLAEKPPQELINRLQSKQIPISVGHVIVSTWEPHREAALEAVHFIGLEYQLIFNKGAVMILPPGINKASGLAEALKELGSSSHNTVVIGDAENDHAMLMTPEFSVAVANALPQIKAAVDWTTSKTCGDGVTELINLLINNDLSELSQQIKRHDLTLGTAEDGSPFCINPYGSRILLAGSSSCGKTTMAVAIIEQLVHSHYQFCLIDPEGDYSDAEEAVTVGDAAQIPLIGQVIQLLKQPAENVSVCMLAIPIADRPAFFGDLLTQIAALRHQTGRPHFLIIDEAHHLIPKEHPMEMTYFFEEMNNILAITTHSELLDECFLHCVNIAMMMGNSSELEMQSFAKLVHMDIPDWSGGGYGNLLVWQQTPLMLSRIESIMPIKLLKRHKRKYAVGDMFNNSFYFKGPDRKLNLRAQNLFVFIQIGEGVDDETWLYHLHRHDYSNWFRNSVKNAELANLCEAIERTPLDARESRIAIFGLIKTQYTTPA